MRRARLPSRSEEHQLSTLVAKDLYLTYGDGYIFDGLSLEVASGAAPVGLIGPSGVGKTTLIADLASKVKPPGGSVPIDGRPVAKRRLKSKSECAARVRAVSQYSMTVSDPRLTPQRRIAEAMKIARRGGRSHATPIEETLA